MPKMLEDKKMKSGDCECLYSKNVMACKWMDNRSVLLLSAALEGMGGVDLMDQRTTAYRLDRKSSVRFYLRIFFDLLDISCINSFFVYNMKHPKQLTLLDYKIVISKNLLSLRHSLMSS